jgi:diguanylate cyclase (GGDEF)-like protein
MESAAEIKILHLEDNPRDAEYIASLLQSDGIKMRLEKAEDRDSYVRLLEEFQPDIVISDFTLPSFDGLSALVLLREKASDIPFLFVSGSIGEELAVECLKQGANDYLLKDKLARLPSAVRRALDEVRQLRERRRAEQQILRNAFYDKLTNLTNRAFFLRRLQQALSREGGNAPALGVAILGIDDFKTLCDGLGWEAGDSLLQAAADRIQEEAFLSADCISRVGGDEFGLLFEGADRVENLVPATEKLQGAFLKPLAWNGQDIYLSVGIGIARAGPDCQSPEELLRDCENALHRAKAKGKSGRVVFNPSMRQQAVNFLETVNDLRRAIVEREFCVHYQPILDLGSGKAAGFEALVRWNHPSRGLVPPLEFIPIAERMHLIASIGNFVMREACRMAGDLHQTRPACRNITFSVNVSAQEFEQAGFCERVEAVLKESGLNPGALKLEITESGFMRNPEGAVHLLRRLRGMGLSLQIDDFGTGYSSLSHLHRFPVQALKIDRSFVVPIDGGEGGSIAAAIIDLAHNLGMQVVAEGIETPEQLAFLKQRGCEFGQGFLFAKPLEAKKAREFLERGPTSVDGARGLICPGRRRVRHSGAYDRRPGVARRHRARQVVRLHRPRPARGCGPPRRGGARRA